MLARIARTCFRHRRLVLVAWIAVLAAAIAGGSALAGHWATNDDGPTSLLTKEFPARDGDDAAIVFTDVTADRAGVDAYLADVAHVPGVLAVEPLQIAPDGHIAIAPLTVAAGVNDKPDETGAAIEQRAGPLDERGVGVQFSGHPFNDGGVPSSELIGIARRRRRAADRVRLASWPWASPSSPRSSAWPSPPPASASWPTSSARPSFTPQVASMIGIGVGIDYALFIVTRYRDALDRGAAVRGGVRRGDHHVRAGRRVRRLHRHDLDPRHVPHGHRVPRRPRRRHVAGRRHRRARRHHPAARPARLRSAASIDRLRVRRRPQAGPRRDVWHRWARFVQRRPEPVAARRARPCSLAAAVPVFAMRLGFADAGNDPTGTTTRAAYDLLAEGFGPGSNGPLVVVADTSTPAHAADVPAAARRRAPDARRRVVGDARRQPVGPGDAGDADPDDRAAGPGHRGAGPPPARRRRPDATARRLQVTSAARRRAASTSPTVIVARGSRCSSVPSSVLSFLLLMVVFRSVLVPLKAVLMNLLSIGAAYGVMVAVFQWGWLGDAPRRERRRRSSRGRR